VRARLSKHAVAISDKVSAIGVVPRNRALLQRVEPVEEDFRISPHGISGVRPLNSVFVQKSHDGLHDLHGGREEEREAGDPWLTQRDGSCCLRGFT